MSTCSHPIRSVSLTKALSFSNVHSWPLSQISGSSKGVSIYVCPQTVAQVTIYLNGRPWGDQADTYLKPEFLLASFHTAKKVLCMLLEEKSNRQYNSSVTPVNYSNKQFVGHALFFETDTKKQVTNHFLIRFKPMTQEEAYMITLSDCKPWARLVIDSRGEPTAIMMPKGHAIRWASNAESLYP